MKMDPVFWYALFACLALSGLFTSIAGFLLLPQEKGRFKFFFRRKKEDLTPGGWQFRQIAVVFSCLAIGVVAAQWLWNPATSAP